MTVGTSPLCLVLGGRTVRRSEDVPARAQAHLQSD